MQRTSSPPSPGGARRGSQEPRYRVGAGEVAYTDGGDAAELSAEAGLRLYPWEDAVLKSWASRDALGRPSYTVCGLDVPRQNGKNAILESYELYLAAVCGWHILHTAHRVKTAKKAFLRLSRYFESDGLPDLRGSVAQIRRTNGEEGIFLANGGSVEFSARTNGSARGFDDVQLVVFDEAQELTDAQCDAIMYTLSASSTGERQIVYTGTPPNESSPGTVFARMRGSALSGSLGKCTWSSWATPELPPPGATFADVLDLVYRANPSMGYVLSEEFTEAEFAGSSLEGFAHERLDWWSPAAQRAAAIPRDLWEGAAIEAVGDLYRRKTALAVKFSPDGSSYALAGCKLDGKGRAAVELVELGSTSGGTAALAQALWERRGRAACVVVDGMAAAEAMCDNLSKLRCPRGYVVRPSAGDVAAAAQMLLDGLRAGSLAHTSQPALSDSATGCARRAIGAKGGWGFGEADGCDPTPVEAASLALWGARTSRRDPKRRQRIL